MKSFDEKYAQLNAAQKEAVDTIDGPVLVVAGPGTGKTQLLGVRVANILNKTDSDPSNVLCLTFTNKAATNMRERLYELVGPESRNVVVRTFHSFAAQVMNEYPDYFWNGARLSVAPDAIQDDIIQNILAQLPLDNPLASTFAGAYTALGDVKNALKLTKEAGLKPDELRTIINTNIDYIDEIEPLLCKILTPSLQVKKLAQLQDAISELPQQELATGSLLLPLSTVMSESLDLAVEQDKQSGKTKQTGKWKQKWVQTIAGQKGMFAERKRNEWWLAIADIYEAYRVQLHQRGYYDYSDMLIEVLEQLQTKPDMLADIQERYLYILIDEFQDTNAAQLRLAHLVATHYSSNNRPNLMAVGDDDQSIFAFNGAELNNMLGFRRAYPDTKVIVLQHNYRSAQAILDTASQIIELAEDRLVKRDQSLTKHLIAQREPKGKIDIQHLSYPTREHQHIAISNRIKELWETGEHDIAILGRKHDSLRQIASVLLRHDIPVHYDQQSNILEHEAVKHAFLIAQLAVAIAEGDKDVVNFNLSKILRHPMWKLSPTTLWKLAVANYSSPDYLDSLLSSEDSNLSSIGSWLVWLSRGCDEWPLATMMEYILGLSEGQYLLSPFKDYYINIRPITSDYLETLSAIQLLRGTSQEFSSNNVATLSDFVRFIELNLNTGRTIANESWFMSGEKAVQLLTVYKAKGLEFDYVYVVDAIESVWSPRSGGRASPANLQLQSYGEKYDDYIRLLYVAASRAKRVFIATSHYLDDKGTELLATPLLSALPLTTITEPEEDSTVVIEESLRWPRLTSKEERAILGDRLEKFSLSPTALIDFLNIVEAGPEGFKERQLIGLPRSRSASGSYGIAIHAALETAQRLVNANQLKLDAVLDRFEASLQEAHLAPNASKRFKERGEKLLSTLLGHSELLLAKGGLTEQRISDIMIENARIKGTLDRIDIHDDELLISDYKTGKPLTNFASKDQTKAVKTWKHRTQLLFYTLLVQESPRFKASKVKTQMIYVEAELSKQLLLPFEPDTVEITRLKNLIEAVWKHIMELNFPDTSAYSLDLKGIRQFEDDLLNGLI